MSYNEYMVTYVKGDRKIDYHTFVEAKSEDDAKEKVIRNSDVIKIIDVKLCDEKFWGL